MPDTFTKVTTTGYGSRLGKSVGGAVLGIVMFLGSFYLLYWNEGRTDLSTVAVDAQVLGPEASAELTAPFQGELVSVTGEVISGEVLGDDLFLNDGPYLTVHRNVEMYAWVEKTEENTQTNVGGSETTTTTYDYVKEWTSDPIQASSFEYPEGHENPSLLIESESFVVGELAIGNFTIDGDVSLPSADALELSADMLFLSSGAELANDEHVFLGNGSLGNPLVGDIRVSYAVLEPGFNGTVLGQLQGDNIVRYVNEDGDGLWRVFAGTHEEAISQLHQEFVVTTWLLRLAGFLLMWLGLASVFGPLSTFLDILPIFGKLSRFLVGAVTFPVALVLSIATILVSMILHSLIAVIIVAVLIIGGVAFYLKQRSAKAKPASV